MSRRPPKEKTKKDRLDTLLFERGLAKSRDRAKSLILAGKVLVDEIKVDKAGTKVSTDSKIRLLAKDHEYVGRGALKIIGALDHFGIDLSGKTVLDAGASTGGFTQAMIERGAAKVFAVDVGYGLLDLKLKNDPRVIPVERTNVRSMEFETIGQRVDMITADLSFISLKKAIPNLLGFIKDGGVLLALIKPQFEVGKGEVEKGGIVKDPEKHKRVIEDISCFCSDRMNLKVEGVTQSPITGADGNKEFFIYCKAVSR